MGGYHVSSTTKSGFNISLSAPGPQESLTGSQGLPNEGTAQSLARADTVELDPQVINLDSQLLNDNPSRGTSFALWDANAELKLLLIENQYLIGFLKFIIKLHTTPEGEDVSGMVDRDLKKFLTHVINVNTDRHGLERSKVKMLVGVINSARNRAIFETAYANMKASLEQNETNLSDVSYTKKR